MNSKIACAILFLCLLSYTGSEAQGNVIKARLNGLEFEFDAVTGGIRSLSYAPTGEMLRSSQDSAGIVDLAFPVKEYEPMRLAPRYSRNVAISNAAGSVTLHWDELGASRNFGIYKGKVAATIILKEMPDGKSISMSCRIENHSDHAIPQIIFPDFSGFLPFCGKENTEFRTGGTTMKPFIDLVVPEQDDFYAMNKSTKWFHYGFVLDGKNLVIKWMDLGGRKGGLSIFSKNWAENKGYEEGVYLRLSEATGKLRYMNTQNTEIAPGASWQSAEFILTPHQNGWAKGIIPYREWAKQNIKRPFPVPDHIRDGLGFRTIWMKTSFYEKDPLRTNFKFSDLPAVAKESKENGLDEINLWGWYENLCIPFTPPYTALGTEQDMARAVAECKKMGVNISPFVSVIRANTESGKRYDIKPSTSNYIYDPEFLPQMNPPYAKGGSASMVPQTNKRWQQDIIASSQHLIDLGVASFCWDQFFSDGSGKSFDTLVNEVRKIARKSDPQAAFSGEAGTNMEFECDYLDYTWNWDYKDNWDYRALISALPQGPRINQNINRSTAETKLAFADNLYLNVMPRKPDGINASDYISKYPEFSQTLKQCARLRKQFLDYFVNGTFIADCILSEDCPDAHVSAYVLPKSMLVIVINKKETKSITLKADLSPWLNSASGIYKVKRFDDGKLSPVAAATNTQWRQKTPVLKSYDICMYELIAE